MQCITQPTCHFGLNLGNLGSESSVTILAHNKRKGPNQTLCLNANVNHDYRGVELQDLKVRYKAMLGTQFILRKCLERHFKPQTCNLATDTMILKSLNSHTYRGAETP